MVWQLPLRLTPVTTVDTTTVAGIMVADITTAIMAVTTVIGAGTTVADIGK